ncbi:MAG: thioredoxin [Coriobacteriales bacterium]|nr:thioredoxin [Coriobacteriales bacterium]
MPVAELTTANFDTEVLQSDTPYLVDFWAAWCGPCRQFSPIVDELAEDMSDKIKVGKLNVDENPEIAQKYRVMSIPAAILYKDGEVIMQNVGAVPKNVIVDQIDQALE